MPRRNLLIVFLVAAAVATSTTAAAASAAITATPSAGAATATSAGWESFTRAGFHRERCNPCAVHLSLTESGGLHAHAVDLDSAFRPTPKLTLVWAKYWNTYESTGWDKLEVEAIPGVDLPIHLKARATGFVEALLTWPDVFTYWTNYRNNEFECGKPTKPLLDWMDKQANWVREQIQEHMQAPTSRSHLAAGMSDADNDKSDSDAGMSDSAISKSDTHKFWSAMNIVMATFDGFVEGYWASCTTPSMNLTRQELYVLQSVGDMYDLSVLFPQKKVHRTASAGRDGTVIGEDCTARGEGGTATGKDGTAKDDCGTASGKDGTADPYPDRQYTPGHGVVGDLGYGEFLECSALIKVNGVLANGHGRTSEGSTGRLPEMQSRGQEQFKPAVQLDSKQYHQAVQQRKLLLDAIPSVGAGFIQKEGVHKLMVDSSKGAARGGFARDHSTGSTADKEELAWWAGHTTWRPYYAMLRTWKVYSVPWVRSGTLSVSSSPGLVMYSKDDWYTTERFVITETTNGIYNKSLFDLIHHDSALMWQRVQVANMVAESGEEWTSVFGIHNSGTYNNQWMVLDVDKLEKGSESDVLWVLEQIPGTIERADVSTQLFAAGFWSSYNVPFFPLIYNTSGYPADQDLHRTCPRARIFDREQGTVHSIDDMCALLRLNRYNQGDSLSEGMPNNAIAARYDLMPVNRSTNWTRSAFGAVDAKVVDRSLFRAAASVAINGPTADNQNPFRWSTSGFDDVDGGGSGDNVNDADDDGCDEDEDDVIGVLAKPPAIAHEGLVDLFDFKWELHQRSFSPW